MYNHIYTIVKDFIKAVEQDEWNEFDRKCIKID